MAKIRKKPNANKLGSKIDLLARITPSSKLRYEITTELSPYEIRTGYNKIKSNKKLQREIEKYKKIAKSELYKDSPNGISPLKSNVQWALNIVQYYANDIRILLDKEEAISTFVLSENPEGALDILDEIDSICGVSIWSENIRTSILEIFDDKSLYERYLPHGDISGSPVFDFIVNRMKGVSKNRNMFFELVRVFKKDVELSLPEFWRSFLRYKILGFEQSYNFDYKYMFVAEMESSYVDIFFLLVDFCENLLLRDKTKGANREFLFRTARDLCRTVPHKSLDGIRNVIGQETDWVSSVKHINIVEAYTSGCYEDVCGQAEREKLLGYDLSIIELIAKSNARTPLPKMESIAYRIVEAMTNVVARGQDYEDSLSFLTIMGIKFKSLGWFKKLLYFSYREAYGVPELDKEIYQKKILLNNKEHTPMYRSLLDGEVESDFRRFLNSCWGDEGTNALFESGETLDKDSKVCNNRKSFYQLKSLYEDGNYESVIKGVDRFLQSEDRLIFIEAAKMLVYSLVKTEQIGEAVVRLVDFVLSDENLISIFDIESILNKADELSRSEESEGVTISVLIAFSLYSRKYDSVFDSNIRYGLESFLLSNSAEVPQDLFDKEEEFGRERLHYFFRWVCQPRLMNLCLTMPYMSQKEFEVCRLEICRYLVEYGNSDDELQSEIKEITQKHIVNIAAKKVAKSKIYVDTSMFYGRDSQKYKIAYENYLESEGGVDHSEDEKMFEWVKAYWRLFEEKNIPRGEIYKRISARVYLINNSERNILFSNFINLIKSDFTMGEAGLNSHLSTRIRHGVLPTELRAAISDEGLYLPGSLDIEKFAVENKWGKMVSGDKDLKEIYSLLSVFSKKYEELIDLINDKWLQVYTISNILAPQTSDGGLFDYSTYPSEVLVVRSDLPISPTYTDAVKVVLSWLWDRTDYNLSVVQKQIREVAHPMAKDLLLNLKNDVSRKLRKSNILLDLCNAIDRSNSKVDASIDQICTWFSHDDSIGDEVFDIQTAIDIAKKTVSIQISTWINDDVDIAMDERQLASMVDLLCILFDNAVTKSNLPKHLIDVRISVSKSDSGRIEIVVKNNCSSDKSVDELNISLNYYREKYGDLEKIKEAIHSEGKTGFFKIWKILEKDLGVKEHDLDIYFDKNYVFTAKILLDAGGKI